VHATKYPNKSTIDFLIFNVGELPPLVYNREGAAPATYGTAGYTFLCFIVSFSKLLSDD
jgi:hypothetical protein